MVDWLQFGADMEDLATQTLRTGKRVTGTLGPTIIQPYRGFVADGVAHVRARVMERPVFDNRPGGLRVDATLAANLLRWVVLDMAGVAVTITVCGQSETVNSNSDGFVIARIPVGDVEPGWHDVQFHAEDRGREVKAAGRVVLPDPASQIGIITDIDDTILTSGMTEGMKALRRTLLRDAYGRKPIPGTPSLYRGLARGTDGRRPESTCFYVSSGPWNLYDMLIQFLGVRGFPRGPLFMTDWRPGAVEGDEEKFESHHKQARIRRILDSYPDLEFVLIGDSGEKDPQIYQEFLDSDPDRIRVAMIRDVTAPPTDIEDRWDGEEPDTASLVTVRNSVEMAEVAQQLGLVDELTVEEVLTEIDARL